MIVRPDLALTFVGPFEQRRFQETLRRDEYTKWASELSREHLRGVLWLAGEFRSRGHGLVDLFDRHPSVVTSSLADSGAARAALRCLLCHDRYDADEARRRLAEGRTEMQFPDLPGSVRTALSDAVPGAKWDNPRVSEFGYSISGSLQTGVGIETSVNCAGEPVVRLSMPESELPKVVLDVLQREFPGSQAAFAYQRAAGGVSADYEIAVLIPRRNNLHRVVVEGDGRALEAASRVGGREPIFSQTFRDELEIGKYTRWASDYSEPSLVGVFWLLGAIAAETLPRLKPASAYVELNPWPHGELRPRFALDEIFRVVAQGERFEAGRMGNLIRSGEQEFQRVCRKSVPFSVRRALEKALPETLRARITRVEKAMDGYQYFGGGGDQTFTVTISHDGASVKTKPCRT